MKPYLDSGQLRNRLKLKSLQAEKKLIENHKSVRTHAVNLLTSGVLASTLLLSSHTAQPASHTLTSHTISISAMQEITKILPKEIQPLTSDQEKEISDILYKVFGIRAFASLEGNKLPQSYGRMGAEQHLARFPGDYVENMAPGLGGWGYVSDPIVEKYYVAVQTLYLPDWEDRTKYLSNWYRFRHVAVVNPANGKVIIAAVADAGPSKWTGKHFGGSPEVMEYLGINYGKQNHPVVLFFVDDPNNQIPLGPLEYNINYDKSIL